MNLTDQKITENGTITIFDSLNAGIMSLRISPTDDVVAPDSNALVISVGDAKAGLARPDAEYKTYTYNLSRPLCSTETDYGEFHQKVEFINNEIKVRAYVQWSINGEDSIEELEPLDIILFHGYNLISTNYQNVEVEVIYPKNNDLNRNFLNTTIYNAYKKSNNELSIDDLYFKDAFTKMGDDLNLEVNNINIDCITSKNNKFSLDEEGNLVVNSITTNQSNSGTNIDSGTICNLIYPIGSIYMSTNSANPSSLFGGVWEQLKDRFLLGSGDTYVNGNIGGEATHKLTTSEMPKHSHNVYEYAQSSWNSLGWNCAKGCGNNYDGARLTGQAGGDQPHNNMPPYLVVNMWKRVS